MNDQLALYNGEEPLRRRADPLWDAVMAVYGLDAGEMTKTERGRYNAKVAELRNLGVDPAEVMVRRQRYRAKYPYAADTFAALAAHWAELATAPQPGPGQTLGALARIAYERDG